MTFELMRYFDKYDQAIVTTGDGDFYWALEYLIESGKEVKLLAHSKSTAQELKQLLKGKFTNLARVKAMLEIKKRGRRL